MCKRTALAYYRLSYSVTMNKIVAQIPQGILSVNRVSRITCRLLSAKVLMDWVCHEKSLPSTLVFGTPQAVMRGLHYQLLPVPSTQRTVLQVLCEATKRPLDREIGGAPPTLGRVIAAVPVFPSGDDLLKMHGTTRLTLQIIGQRAIYVALGQQQRRFLLFQRERRPYVIATRSPTVLLIHKYRTAKLHPSPKSPPIPRLSSTKTRRFS